MSADDIIALVLVKREMERTGSDVVTISKADYDVARHGPDGEMFGLHYDSPEGDDSILNIKFEPFTIGDALEMLGEANPIYAILGMALSEKQLNERLGGRKPEDVAEKLREEVTK